MNTLAVGLWGCFFGVVTTMLVGSFLAYAKSLMRMALMTALSAMVLALFVLAFLSGFEADFMTRLLAHGDAATSSLMAYLFLTLKERLKTSGQHHRVRTVLALFTLFVMGAGWWLTPEWALIFSGSASGFLLLSVYFLARRSIKNGSASHKLLNSGLFFHQLLLSSMTWIVLEPALVPVVMHALSALAATLCLLCIAAVLLMRYFGLMELRRIMTYGSQNDPVTRMRSPKQTLLLVDEVFKQFQRKPAPMGIIVLSIGNLLSLEKLYGRAAVNHALFVCAGRLKRYVPDSVEMGRLSANSFALIMPSCINSGQLIGLAQFLIHQLRINIDLKTNSQAQQIETFGKPWVADVGMGLLLISNPAVCGASAIGMARGMSHTAASYASRIAWFDHGSAQIVELSDSYNPSSI